MMNDSVKCCRTTILARSITDDRKHNISVITTVFVVQKNWGKTVETCSISIRCDSGKTLDFRKDFLFQ